MKMMKRSSSSSSSSSICLIPFVVVVVVAVLLQTGADSQTEGANGSSDTSHHLQKRQAARTLPVTIPAGNTNSPAGGTTRSAGSALATNTTQKPTTKKPKPKPPKKKPSESGYVKELKEIKNRLEKVIAGMSKKSSKKSNKRRG